MADRRENKPKGDKGGTASDIKCPFFRRHSRQEIRCEGVMDGTSCSINFSGARLKSWYQATYCEEHYDKCEHYRVLMDNKYAD